MQALALFLLSVFAACRADTLSQLESYCIRECGTPEYDQLVEELDHQDELLNEVATKAMNLEHKLDEWKHELEEADKDSKNMLLRLDRLHSDKEEAVCPKKHFKCLKGDSKRHEKCISDILVCDGEPDCLDGSDEDENLCTIPVKTGETWSGPQAYWKCTPGEAVKKSNLTFIFTKFEQDPVIKPLVKVEANVFWIDSVDEGAATYNRSAPLYGYYNIATKTVKNTFILYGRTTLMTFEFYSEYDLFIVDSYLLPSMTHCESAVMFKNTW